MIFRTWHVGTIPILAWFFLAASSAAQETPSGWATRNGARQGRSVAVAAPRPLGFDAAVPPPGRMLGTFYPESTVMITGSGESRGGYAPLDMYGLSTASFVGPLSVYRIKTAPVATYSRGYDGRFYPSRGISFSYPNFPVASPVVYPTPANNAYGFPTSGVPPWWRSSINWLDQD